MRFELVVSSMVESGANYSLPDVQLRWRSIPVRISDGRNYSADVVSPQEMSVSRPDVDVLVESDEQTLGRLDGTAGSVVTMNVSIRLPEATMAGTKLNVSVPVGDAEELYLLGVRSVRVLRGGVEEASPNSVLQSSCSGVGGSGFDLQPFLSSSSLFVSRGSGLSWYSVSLCDFANVDRDDGSAGASEEVLEIVLEGTIQNVSGVARGEVLPVTADFETATLKATDYDSLAANDTI